MLLVLMYHRVTNPARKLEHVALRRHFESLARRYPVVLPGEQGRGGEVAVCLTFDDAYYDFYAVVFPLLVQLRLRAVLAAPVDFIVEDTDVSPATRLAVPVGTEMNPAVRLEKTPFCTWRELRKMAASGSVVLASHTCSHANLNDPEVDLAHEIVRSKEVLQAKAGVDVGTFVYPYGNWNAGAHQLVHEHYRYAMRIGSALNKSWDQPGKLLYRIDADPLWPRGKTISAPWLVKHQAKYFLNRLRGK